MSRRPPLCVQSKKGTVHYLAPPLRSGAPADRTLCGQDTRGMENAGASVKRTCRRCSRYWWGDEADARMRGEK